MKTIVKVTALLLALALLLVAYPPRTYNGAGYAGIAWDWGGIEYQPSLALFLCPGQGHMDQTTNTWIQDWSNPLAPIFPALVTDC